MAINFAALLFFGVFWGASVPLLKFAVEAGYHPLGMLIWQMAVGAIVLGVYRFYKYRKITVASGCTGYLMFIAIIGTLIPNTFSLYATRHLPAGIIALALATVPIMSLSIALLARIESFSWVRFAGILLGVGSLMLIALPDSVLPDRSAAPWILVALIAPVCYAVEGNYVAAKAPADLSAIDTLFGASVAGLLVLLPVVFFFQWQITVFVPWDATRWAMLAAGLCHVTAYSGYLWLLGRAGAVFTSQVAYIVTLTGVLASVIFLHERYGLLLWLAVGMMLAALVLVKPVSAIE